MRLCFFYLCPLKARFVIFLEIQWWNQWLGVLFCGFMVLVTLVLPMNLSKRYSLLLNSETPNGPSLPHLTLLPLATVCIFLFFLLDQAQNWFLGIVSFLLGCFYIGLIEFMCLHKHIWNCLVKLSRIFKLYIKIL